MKSAQQKARTFREERRAYDPPPIKEKEKRMTGELTKFNDGISVVIKKLYSQQQIRDINGRGFGYY